MSIHHRHSLDTCETYFSGGTERDDDLAKTLQNLMIHSRDGLVYSPGLWKNLMIDFTLTFLITNPNDLIAFGLEYFQNLRTKKCMLADEKARSVEGESVEGDEVDDVNRKFAERMKRKSGTKERKVSATFSPPPRVRRKSVFADIVSDEDDNDEWKPAVHPKTDEQRRNCRERMKEVMLFREVAPDDLSLLVDAMVYKEVEPGERVIIQGADGDYFYIIDSGLFEAYYSTSDGVRVIAKYNNHGTFGELALMYNVPRTCSVKALTRGGLWALDRDTFKRVVVKGAKRKRTRYMNFLHRVPLLRNLNEYEMLNLADSFQRRTFNIGDCVIKQGDEADGMYFIEEGKIAVSIMDEHGVEIGLHELNVGDYFGELALIEKKPRAASAYAMTEVKVAFLNTEAFERLLGPCRSLMERKVSEYRKEISSRGKSTHSVILDSPDKPKQSILVTKKEGELGHGGPINVRLVSPGDFFQPEDHEPVLKRKSARRSSTSRLSRASRASSRSSKFYDRKPSIFQMLPEVMSRSDPHSNESSTHMSLEVNSEETKNK